MKRFSQLSKLYWLVHVRKVFPEQQLQLKTSHLLSSYSCCWRAGSPDHKKSLFPLLVWEWYMLAALHGQAEEEIFIWGEQRRTPGLYFQPYERLLWSMEKQWRCSWAACSPAIPHPRNDRSGQSLACMELVSWNQTTWNMADISSRKPCLAYTVI